MSSCVTWTYSLKHTHVDHVYNNGTHYTHCCCCMSSCLTRTYSLEHTHTHTHTLTTLIIKVHVIPENSATTSASYFRAYTLPTKMLPLLSVFKPSVSMLKTMQVACRCNRLYAEHFQFMASVGIGDGLPFLCSVMR